MANETKRQSVAPDEYEQLFADWVYWIPGALLIVGGFGGLAFMTLF